MVDYFLIISAYLNTGWRSLPQNTFPSNQQYRGKIHQRIVILMVFLYLVTSNKKYRKVLYTKRHKSHFYEPTRGDQVLRKENVGQDSNPLAKRISFKFK